VGVALRPGTHACCWFTGEEHKRAVVSGYVTEGLAAGERIAFYPRDGDASVLATWLPGLDVDALTRTGQLLVESAETAYFVGGTFDGPGRAQGFRQLAEQTVMDGFPGLRVYADNGWMPAAVTDPSDWIEYELRIGQMVPDYPLIGLCGYDEADASPLPPPLIDAVHEVNLVATAEGRPSPFHVIGLGDEMALLGELDRFTAEEMDVVLSAAKSVMAGGRVSLDGVNFSDGASAEALLDFLVEADAELTGVSPFLSRVWSLLGLMPPTRSAG
jgi:hypothetical protein